MHIPVLRGEQHPAAKLTDDAVRDMRARRAKGEKLASIAKRHHVDEPLVSRICRGKRWGHVLTEKEG